VADFYGTLDDATAYMAARSYTWTGTDADKDAALLRGSEYVDSLGMVRPCFWVGTKTGGRAQVRQWPRTGAVDGFGDPVANDEVPQEVINATYEASYRELASPGSLNPDYVASDTFKQAKVGPLEVTYATSSDPDAIPTKPVVSVINDLIGPLLTCWNPSAAVFVV
jgi:hypothetical protein